MSDERETAAVDGAIAAVKAEHGDWFGGMAEVYRHVVTTAIQGALKAVDA